MVMHRCRTDWVMNCPAAVKLRRDFALDLYQRGEKVEFIQRLLEFSSPSSIIQIVKAAGAPLRGYAHRRKAVEALDPMTLTVVRTFPSTIAVALEGFNPNAVWKAMNGLRDLHHGFRWRYAA